ncbi:MAG: T9SS type A sorting domain-containing protein [bacterium]
MIIEDSCYYAAPNGDQRHNHVARDYVPNQIGQQVIIPPGDSATLTQNFTIQSGWNVSRCKIVTWIQNSSTREVYQAGFIKVSDLTGINEGQNATIYKKVVSMPNPCVNGTKFQFNISSGKEWKMLIFDVLGREIQRFYGTGNGTHQSFEWDLHDNRGNRVKSGIYFYRFISPELNTTGKIVVR